MATGERKLPPELEKLQAALNDRSLQDKEEEAERVLKMLSEDDEWFHKTQYPDDDWDIDHDDWYEPYEPEGASWDDEDTTTG